MENSSGIFERLPEFSRIGSFSFLLWAVLIGVFLSVVVNMGPAFITLVQTSLHRGFKSAAWFVAGVILNDAMIISIYIMTSVQVVMRSDLDSVTASRALRCRWATFCYRWRRSSRQPPSAAGGARREGCRRSSRLRSRWALPCASQRASSVTAAGCSPWHRRFRRTAGSPSRRC